MLNIAHLFMTRQLDYPITAWYSIVYHLKVLLAYLNHPPFRQYFWYFLFVLLFCLISWVYFCIFFLCCLALCKSFLVVHHEIFCLSYLLSWYTHTPKGVCIHRKYKWLVRYCMVFHGTLYLESVFGNFYLYYYFVWCLECVLNFCIFFFAA